VFFKNLLKKSVFFLWNFLNNFNCYSLARKLLSKKLQGDVLKSSSFAIHNFKYFRICIYVFFQTIPNHSKRTYWPLHFKIAPEKKISTYHVEIFVLNADRFMLIVSKNKWTHCRVFSHIVDLNKLNFHCFCDVYCVEIILNVKILRCFENFISQNPENPENPEICLVPGNRWFANQLKSSLRFGMKVIPSYFFLVGSGSWSLF